MKFYKPNQKEKNVSEPHNGWAGVWRTDSDNWDYIGFVSKMVSVHRLKFSDVFMRILQFGQESERF